MEVDAVPVAAPAASSSSLVKPEDEEVAARTLAQVEFYFNDANLPFDKFLYTTSMKDPLKQGWVAIDLVASFKRMREFQPKGLPWIAEVLRRSESLLEVDETGKKVRRKTPLVPPQDAFARSIYAKGFPDQTDTLQQELETYFGKFGKVNVVRMRRDDAKAFKNSVFVEFEAMEDAEAFLALDPKPQYEGKELVTMSKEAYVQMKMKEKGIEPGSERRGGSPRPEGAAPKGRPAAGDAGKRQTVKFNAFHELKKIARGELPIWEKPVVERGGDKKEDRKAKRKREEEEEEERKKKKIAEVTFEYLGGKHAVTPEGKLADPSKLAIPEGHVVTFSGAGPEGDWRVLKADLIAAGFEAPFLAFPKGSATGSFENTAKAFDAESLAALNALGLVVGGEKISWAILEPGEALTQHYVNRANFQAKRALDSLTSSGALNAAPTESAKGAGGGRGGGRGGRGGGRGRGEGRGGGRGGRGGGRGGKSGERNAEKKAAAEGGAEKPEGGSAAAAGPRPIDKDAPAGQGVRGAAAAPSLATSD